MKQPAKPVGLAIHLVNGFGARAINPILAAIRYERVPVAMRGRIVGVPAAGSDTAMPLVGLIPGYLLDGGGLATTLLLAASCFVISTLTPLVNPADLGCRCPLAVSAR